MQSSSPVFIYSSEIASRHYPAGCPFKTERATETRSILRTAGDSFFREEPPRRATETELRSFHTEAYLEMLQRISGGDLRAGDLFFGVGTDDCPVFPDLYPYAVLAAGGSIRAAELLLAGETPCCFNPSGGYHHAFSDRAGGFCYINDVVLACKRLLASGRRIFCLDLDAHHGNGTQAAFYDDPRVLTVSFHESGRTLFPWGGFEDEIGEGAGEGYNVNVPLPAGTDDDAFTRTFRAVVPPLISAYRPDSIVLEIGMDILAVDPLTHLNMTNNAIADTLPLLRDSAIPILAVGGGGYHPEATARGWALAWQVLCGVEPESDLTIGMGGVFLGTTEVSGGLRDMRVYTRGGEKRSIDEQLEKVVGVVREKVFPVHGIAA
ncbi:MAG: acetoin utilization protein AcuC [Chitinispirillaceae bacterium]|nr:acetoin utilization protein AcuC [Chitinispirillaceae bacterium]